MPVNPNIALGVQPIQQPNMLAQYGQMMALKAAQQEMQSNEEMRNLFAGGANFDDPDFQKRGYMANPKAFQELLGKRATTNKTQMEALGKEVALRRDAITNINTPEDYLKWHDANHQGSLGAFFKSAGISPSRESIIAQLNQPGGLDKLKRESALGATALQKELMQTERSVIAAGPGNRQASIAEQNFAIQQADRAQLDALYGRTPTSAPATTPMGGGGGGGGGGSSIMVNPAQSNALIQGTAPALSPNMLRPDAQAPVVAPAPVTAARVGDLYAQISAIDAEIARLPLNNPKSIPIAQALNAQRTALLASAKQEFGGNQIPIETTGPDGRPVTVMMRPNRYGVNVPVETASLPLSTDASATGGTGISPTVARPAPTAAVVKERQAVEKLPEAIAMNTDAIRKIDEMIGGVDAKGNPLPGAKGQAHPGLNKATGFGGGVMRFFSGTDGKNFEIRHKEVLSQAFLDAFEALKGGGAITEKEGEKATAARTRMDLAQSKEEYMEAAREYQGVLKRGVENARARMQRSGSTPPAAGGGDTQKTISRTGTLNGRKVIEYSDGTTAYAD